MVIFVLFCFFPYIPAFLMALLPQALDVLFGMIMGNLLISGSETGRAYGAWHGLLDYYYPIVMIGGINHLPPTRSDARDGLRALEYGHRRCGALFSPTQLRNSNDRPTSHPTVNRCRTRQPTYMTSTRAMQTSQFSTERCICSVCVMEAFQIRQTRSLFGTRSCCQQHRCEQ